MHHHLCADLIFNLIYHHLLLFLPFCSFFLLLFFSCSDCVALASFLFFARVVCFSIIARTSMQSFIVFVLRGSIGCLQINAIVFGSVRATILPSIFFPGFSRCVADCLFPRGFRCSSHPRCLLVSVQYGFRDASCSWPYGMTYPVPLPSFNHQLYFLTFGLFVSITLCLKSFLFLANVCVWDIS